MKQSAEYWKEQIRDKLGENLGSQLANGLINFASETGDMAMLGGDTAFDLVAALATCATGDGYCSQARSDLAKKDAAAASMLNSIMSGDVWEGIKSSAIKAVNGDQKALENVAGILSGALLPAKILSSGGKTGSMAEQAASKGMGSLVDAEKVALERIGKNSNATTDLNNKLNYSVLDKQAAKSNVVVEQGKLDYIFGNVDSNAHNAARSTQMEQSMYRLGISVDDAGAKYLAEHLSQVPKTPGNIVDVYSNQWGKFEVRESLLFGPSGKATKLQSAFQIMPDGSRRFVTTIPKDGQK